MSERELLELAAKAAGIARSQWDYEWVRGLGHMVCRSNMWNPLADDGDALRLAVKLSIDFYVGEDDGEAFYAGYFVIGSTSQQFAIERGGDMDSARRSIVRAAAEIGRSMP